MKKEDFTTKDYTELRNGICQIRLNYWWWCENGDPKKAVFFTGTGRRNIMSPQCNIAKSVLEYFGKPYDGCEIIRIPFTCEPVDPHDFV